MSDATDPPSAPEHSLFRCSPSSPGSRTHYGYIDALAEYEFWLLAGGAVLLVIGVVFRKL